MKDFTRLRRSPVASVVLLILATGCGGGGATDDQKKIDEAVDRVTVSVPAGRYKNGAVLVFDTKGSDGIFEVNTDTEPDKLGLAIGECRGGIESQDGKTCRTVNKSGVVKFRLNNLSVTSKVRELSYTIDDNPNPVLVNGGPLKEVETVCSTYKSTETGKLRVVFAAKLSTPKADKLGRRVILRAEFADSTQVGVTKPVDVSSVGVGFASIQESIENQSLLGLGYYLSDDAKPNCKLTITAFEPGRNIAGRLEGCVLSRGLGLSGDDTLVSELTSTLTLGPTTLSCDKWPLIF